MIENLRTTQAKGQQGGRWAMMGLFLFPFSRKLRRSPRQPCSQPSPIAATNKLKNSREKDNERSIPVKVLVILQLSYCFNYEYTLN